MKIKKKVLNDTLVRNRFYKYESKIRSFKVLNRLNYSSYLETLNNFSKLKSLSFLTKTKNRCFITCRGGGINRKTGLSRIKVRELANNGLIPGFVKHSW